MNSFEFLYDISNILTVWSSLPVAIIKLPISSLILFNILFSYTLNVQISDLRCNEPKLRSLFSICSWWALNEYKKVSFDISNIKIYP